MAIIKRKGNYHLALFLRGRHVWIAAGTESKRRAQEIEQQILVAAKAQDFRCLDPGARAVCVKLWQNQGWSIPTDLLAPVPLTIGEAVKEYLSAHLSRRTGTILNRITDYSGATFPISDLWIPQIRNYLDMRRAEGASASTVNKEKAGLSKLFQWLIESRRGDANPVRMIPNFSEKEGQREAYVSYSDFREILDNLPAWFRPVAQTAYYTGMRRGEILSLTRKQINLVTRMITLSPDDTKEGHWKRIPIHSDLIPILESALRVQSLGTDAVFLRDGREITGNVSAFWSRAASKVYNTMSFRFHDLRATWKTNARRSGMHPEIEKAIMGHSDRGRTVHERYGRISDQELTQTIDQVTFEHGATEVIFQGKRSASR